MTLTEDGASAGPTAALELQGLTKRFGDVVAVDDQTLSVRRGEVVSLLGPSGCGKSTTLRMIAGLETPTTGQVLIHGRTVTRDPPSARNVGLVPQDYGIFPHLSVWENVAFGLRMRKVGKQELVDRVSEALELVRLTPLRERRKNQLSGGQQQRVALARAIVIRPHVLLLDEPLGALDKQLRSRMQVELRRLQEQVAVTTVIVTHDQEEALTLSDRIAVMNEGRIQQIGAPAQLYTHPESRFVAEFMGAANFIDATVRGVDADHVTLERGRAHFPARGEGRRVGDASSSAFARSGFVCRGPPTRRPGFPASCAASRTRGSSPSTPWTWVVPRSPSP